MDANIGKDVRADESMMDVVRAYANTTRDSLERIAARQSARSDGIGNGTDPADSTLFAKVKGAIKELTDAVNRDMIHRQSEYANTGDILFALASLNGKVSRGCEPHSDEVLRLVKMMRAKNFENAAKGIGNMVDEVVLMRLESAIEGFRRSKWVPING